MKIILLFLDFFFLINEKVLNIDHAVVGGVIVPAGSLTGYRS